eukprot:CAMPEP_0119079882 /NCGR_PEP_ID=MMETSP1178-20130426/109583_1 /TAXON_ID=33656 /ORGANISM="unid sp, Strain CCMP2000" /LENGTH=56 /DNA_ID=CAMNT_0007062437 /DNA_START=174 /DNA_END=342 /DNA_ORIENTATION=+
MRGEATQEFRTQKFRRRAEADALAAGTPDLMLEPRVGCGRENVDELVETDLVVAVG